MSIISQEELDNKWFRTIGILLMVVLFVKIGGFFTWSENINITRVVKVFSRIMMTISIIWIYRKIVNKGAIGTVRWEHTLAPVLYMAYLFLGLASLMWSTKPGYSGLQWFMDIESLVFAFYYIRCFVLLDKYFPQGGIRFSNVLGNATFMMLLIFIIGMWVDPDNFYRLTHGGEEARLGGLFMNPNELGMLCVVGISSLIFDLYTDKSKLWCFIKMAGLMYALIMTGSRSTTIGFLIVAFFHINQSKHIKLKIAMYAGGFAIIPVAVSTMIVKEHGGGLEEVMSMTGRLPFWQALLTEGFPKEPLLGFGFMRIAYKDFFQGVHTYPGQMTHNTFIQVLMNLGIVGFTIVFYQMVATVKGIMAQDKTKKLMLVGFMIPVIINSFTEFGIFGETNYGILFYQLTFLYVSVNIQDKLTPKEKLFLKKRRPDLDIKFA